MRNINGSYLTTGSMSKHTDDCGFWYACFAVYLLTEMEQTLSDTEWVGNVNMVVDSQIPFDIPRDLTAQWPTSARNYIT